MPTPFSSQDLGRVFDARALTRGRSLGLAGSVAVELEADTIKAVVQDRGFTYRSSMTPALLCRRVVFDHQCSCGLRSCAHLAAAAFAALDQFPALRKAEQQTFFDTLVGTPDKSTSSEKRSEVETVVEPERHRVVFELAPADPPDAAQVSVSLIGERSGATRAASFASVAADNDVTPEIRAL